MYKCKYDEALTFLSNSVQIPIAYVKRDTIQIQTHNGIKLLFDESSKFNFSFFWRKIVI